MQVKTKSFCFASIGSLLFSSFNCLELNLYFISFSPPILLKRGSEKTAGWPFECQNFPFLCLYIGVYRPGKLLLYHPEITKHLITGTSPLVIGICHTFYSCWDSVPRVLWMLNVKAEDKGKTAAVLMPVFVAALMKCSFSKQCQRLIALSSMLDRLGHQPKTWPNFAFLSNPF